ncbi:MAG: hypothetical protein HY001_00190 [Candidatus Portnoybacteria bacterium]|nr:hypothetical protein [Candidatus Portnoybacteria bacterium]
MSYGMAAGTNNLNFYTMPRQETGGGREIADIEVIQEHFTKLEKGRDYEILQQNPHVTSQRNVEDFFIFINPRKGDELRSIKAPHWRTISEENVDTKLLIGEKEIPYYEVNTKGAGYLKRSAKGKNFNRMSTWVQEDATGQQRLGYKVLGLSSLHEYENGDIISRSEKLVENGLRAEVYWAVGKVKQLPYKGKLQTIEQLKKKEIILDNPEYEPAMAVRIMRTNDRIEEAARSHERRKEIFEKAFSIFNKETRDRGLSHPELVIGDSSHERRFFRVFFRRMGENMAILLNLGMADYYMHSSNITMAAEIADIGSITHWREDKEETLTEKYGGVRKGHIKDMRDMMYALRMLINAGKVQGLAAGTRERLKEAFFHGFDKVVDSQKVKGEDTDPQKAREWMGIIFDTVIIHKEGLPSLQHYDIEDWPIRLL